MAGQLRITVADRIATLVLDDAPTLNALGLPLARALHEALRGVGSGEIECRAVVLTGASRAFCSGGRTSRPFASMTATGRPTWGRRSRASTTR